MSLMPLLFSNWWWQLDRPHRLFDQNFGLPLNPDDMVDELGLPSSEVIVYRPKRLQNRNQRYHPFLHKLARKGGQGSYAIPTDKFSVSLDVQQFHLQEIDVRVIGDSLVINAKHEDRHDAHGWISRQFTRKYKIPNECEVDKIESHLSSDGILTISIPIKQTSEPNGKVIPIKLIGQPAISRQEASFPEGSSSSRDQNQPLQVPQHGQNFIVKAA